MILLSKIFLIQKFPLTGVSSAKKTTGFTDSKIPQKNSTFRRLLFPDCSLTSHRFLQLVVKYVKATGSSGIGFLLILFDLFLVDLVLVACRDGVGPCAGGMTSINFPCINLKFDRNLIESNFNTQFFLLRNCCQLIIIK